MHLKGDWWALQLLETLKEIASEYDRFLETGEIEDYDGACELYEVLIANYGVSLDLLDVVKLGRALQARQALPKT